MMRNLLLLCLAMGFAHAQYQFRVPSDQKDLSQNWTVGDTMNIAWSAVQDVYDDESFRKGLWDLHVTWFSSDGFQQLIKPNVSLTVRDSYNWKIDVPNETAKIDDRFVLRFAPARNPPKYIPNSNESPSRGFYINPRKEESTTSSSSTAAPTESSSSSSTTSSPTSSPSSSASPSDDGSKTNVGAIAGGVVGGVAAIALIAIAALLFMRNRKHKRDGAATAQYAAQPQDYSATPTAELRNTAYHGPGQAYDPAPDYKYGMTAPPQQPYSTMPTELPTTTAPPVELDSGAAQRHH